MTLPLVVSRIIIQNKLIRAKSKFQKLTYFYSSLIQFHALRILTRKLIGWMTQVESSSSLSSWSDLDSNDWGLRQTEWVRVTRSEVLKRAILLDMLTMSCCSRWRHRRFSPCVNNLSSLRLTLSGIFVSVVQDEIPSFFKQIIMAHL